MTDYMSALRAKVALRRAEYRHEWDYGTEASTERALKRLLLSAALLHLEESALELGYNHMVPEEHVRTLANSAHFAAEHALPRKK